MYGYYQDLFYSYEIYELWQSIHTFFEKAKELENIVLTNKVYQTTRFVRALKRGITAALRNLPTLISVIAEEYEEAVLNCENAKAKELKSTLDKLRDGETLIFAIGLSQLLESYCLASLESQYTSHLPIQVWRRIDFAKTDLEQLANEWKWKETKLKLAGIGTTQTLVSSILLNGSYEPFVPINSI